MEQFVLGIFQEQLSKIIVGFRKEQINSNLLNGKGEILDVELNCNFLNDLSSKLTPLVEFEKVTVSKLSFHVSSWANLRKAPIIIDVGHVTAHVVEPFKFLNEKDGRESIQQISKEQLLALIKEGVVKTRGAYNLFDRIVDNLTVEISSIQISFQTYGKFKTRRPGPWTPPCWYINFSNLRFSSVNEFGHEGSPDEVWRHNHRRSGDSLLIYKKLCMDYNIAIKPLESIDKIQLVTGRENQVEIQMAIKRRIKDGELLAVQMDTTIPTINIDLPQYAVPHVTHAFLGLLYCLAKDREFIDPLKPLAERHGAEKKTNDYGPNILSTPVDISENASVEVQLPIDLDDVNSSSDEDDQSNSGSKKQSNGTVGNEPFNASVERPIILLPSGICIHESLSLSGSIYEVAFRGSYEKEEGIEVGDDLQPQLPRNGYFELKSKGCIAEAIWPKVSLQKGGYVQASVAFFTLEESFHRQNKTIVSGGSHFHFSGTASGRNASFEENASRDERFPLFEDRAIRPDPLSLRHTFPAQALALKATVEFLPQNEIEVVQTMHELGVEDVQVTMESESLFRIASFLVNENGGGFDTRWRSGDWSSLLTPDLFLNSAQTPLALDKYLQQIPQVFLDDNHFLSSDLFNVTARLKRVCATMPASIRSDIKSCGIVFFLNEAMFLVSSALPRTIATGKLANPDGKIVFPSDRKDIFFEMEEAEDPSNRQRGMSTSRNISTFRVQATFREFSIRFEPIVDYYISKGRDLVAPMEVTMIFCFEGQAPPGAEPDAAKMAFYITVMAQECTLNLDLDLLAASISTLLHHQSICEDRLPRILDIVIASLTENKLSSSWSFDENHIARFPKTLQGRRAWIKRQVTKSWASGGVSFTSCVHFSKLCVMLWRQHVLLQIGNKSQPDSIVPALCLLDLTIMEVELAAEASLFQDSHRVIIKSCLSSLCLSLMDLGRVHYSSKDKKTELKSLSQHDRSGYMVPVISLSSKGGMDHAFALRADDYLENSRSLAISTVVNNAAVSLYPELLATLLDQIWESMNMPYYQAPNTNQPDGIFPCGSVGYMFERIITKDSWVFGVRMLFLEHHQFDFSEQQGKTVEAQANAILADVVELIPENVSELLVRLVGNSVIVSIGGNSPSGQFEVNLHDIDLVSAYSRSNTFEHSRHLRTPSAKNESWYLLIDTSRSGLQQLWTMKHSVSCRRGDDLVYPVSPFGVSWKYASSKSTIVVGDEIKFNQTEQLDQFLWCVYHTWIRIQTLGGRHQVATSGPRTVTLNPGKSVLDTVVAIMDISNEYLERINEALFHYSGLVQIVWDMMEKDLKLMRIHAFLKENERFAAHALSASQVAGWVRLGMPSNFGQRRAFSSTVWPYWAVLRKGFIVVHHKPTRESTVDVISLKGATLHGLTSENNHRDLQRAFGVLVQSGALYLVSLSSEKEYNDWIVAINRSIEAYADNKMDLVSEGSEKEPLSPSVVDTIRLPSDDVPVDPIDDGKTSEESSTQNNARATTLCMPDTTFENTEGFNASSSLKYVTNDALPKESEDRRSARRNQIRNRFAGMGQATKSKFGSVVSTAREKGRAVVGRALVSSKATADGTNDIDASSSVDLLPCDSKEVEVSVSKDLPAASSDSKVPERQRALSGVGNKLGAAVKSVRHSMRKTQSNDGFPSNVESPIKLRDILLAAPVKISEQRNETEKLMLIEGNWIVQTTLLASKNPEVSDMLPEKDAEIVDHYEEARYAFQISLFSTPASQAKVVTKDIFDVASLHTTISECVGRMPPPASYAASDDSSDSQHQIDFVRTTAVLLDGLIGHRRPMGEMTPYHAEIVNEFLTALLRTRLPSDGHQALIDFLGLDESHSHDFPDRAYPGDAAVFQDDAQKIRQDVKLSRDRAFHLLKECQSKISDAKSTIDNQNSTFYQQPEELPKKKGLPSQQTDPDILHLAGPVLSTRLHNTVYDALMKVMVQRDEARAKFASGEIVFLQELEQQQRKIERLENELEATRVNIKAEDADHLRRRRNMQENSDQEMLMLCQQLSNEISARTEVTLELERVNEIREIERANAATEKQSLQEQIIRLTKALEQEKAEK